MTTTGQLGPCIHCGSARGFFCEARDENRKISGAFTYARCFACSVISLLNPPENLAPYYGDDYYDIPDISELERRANRESCKISSVTRFVSRGRMLEVGPAFGAFALRALNSGFSVTVIEQDHECCKSLKRLPEMSVIESDDPASSLKGLGTFDVIALWHVIEHLRDPFGFIRAAAEALKPGGILALGTPNPEAWQFHVMKSAWPHLDAPRHLHLLPAQSLITCGEACGLVPLLVDSDDSDARSWNYFGWQRLLMNRLPTRVGAAIGFITGSIIAGMVAPLDRRQMRGAAYTMVLQKQGAERSDQT